MPQWCVDPSRTVRGKIYNMEPFVDQCIENFCTLAVVDRSKLKKFQTPFIDESFDPTESRYA